MFHIFEDSFNMASKAGYNNIDRFKSLVIKIIRSRLHLRATSDPKWNVYSKEKQTEAIYTSEGYWRLKIEKTELENSITDLFFQYETQLQYKNEMVKHIWRIVLFVPENKYKL